MNLKEQFELEKAQNIKKLGDPKFKKMGLDFARETSAHNYSYNFTWMGRPIIQFPQDMLAMQEIIWEVKPDLIIETGIAHGGSLIYYASLMELIGKGEVIGIDIDIREHNRQDIEQHPMFKRITMLQGSSISTDIVEQVKKLAKNKPTILVCLDSNHTHDHVLEELGLYSGFVSKGSYLIVFDTIIDDMPNDFFPNRRWGENNNPKTAVKEFLKENKTFEIDEQIQHKLVVSVAPEGYLKKI